MRDDWRVSVDFEDEDDAAEFAEHLEATELGEDERRLVGERVVVSRDGPRVFLYADTEERARELERTVRARLESDGAAAASTLTRWHPVEEAWRDASVPLPASAEEIEAERERRDERETRESLGRGYAEWEVRVELPSHDETIALAERLETEEIPVVRRWRFLLVGAANRDNAQALAERLQKEAPAGARIAVEPGGGLAWEVTPQNPFAVFGGLGA